MFQSVQPDGTVVEVVDHGLGVKLAPLPFVEAGGIKRTMTPLGEHELNVWKSLMHAADVFERVVHIPMETDSPDEFGSVRIVEDRCRPLVHHRAVVVPNDDFLIA